MAFQQELWLKELDGAVQLRRRLLLLLLPHLCAPREVAVVQTQGPELVVATTHTQPPHSHVRGELGVGRLATKLIPAISSRKFSCCCPEKAVADRIQRKRLVSYEHCMLNSLLLLAPVLLASTGRPAFVQRITGNTCKSRSTSSLL